MQGSAVPAEADGPCISENNDEISPEILYRNEKENQQNSGLVRNITGWISIDTLAICETDTDYSGALYAESDKYRDGATRSAKATGAIRRLRFDASRYITTSTENRPYNISAIPLIVAI